MKNKTNFIFPILCAIAISVAACRKDKGIPVPADNTTFPDTVAFVFTNRLGNKSDSINLGSGNYECLRSACISTIYYNPIADSSWIFNACYNRNYPVTALALSDSIVHYKNAVYHGANSAMQIALTLKNQSAVVVKKLIYSTLYFPNGDTIKTNKDTVIKFIWPVDTASGRFVKIYQYP